MKKALHLHVHLQEKGSKIARTLVSAWLCKSHMHFKRTTSLNLPLFVSYAQIAIAKVPTTIRINPASAFLLNFSLNTK